jgi:hypothetical protein
MYLTELLRGTALDSLLVGGRQWRPPGSTQLVAFTDAATVGHALEKLLSEGLRTAPIVAAGAGVAATPSGEVSQGGFPVPTMRGYVEAAAVIEELLQGNTQSSGEIQGHF